MNTRLIFVTTDTGDVVGSWSGDDQSLPATPSGQLAIPVDPETPLDPHTKRWNGTVLVDVPVIPVVTRYQFLQLFTSAERIAIIKMAQLDDAVLDFYTQTQMSEPQFPLNHPAVIAGVNLLVAKGVVLATRLADILAGVPPSA